MSALPLKADILRRYLDVRFGPLADIPPIHSMTSSALASSEAGIVTPNAFAALRLMTSTAQVVVDGNGLRQQLAMGQQQKQRVPAQIKFSTHPLCFDFSTTDAEIVAGGSLPESCPKNGDLPKSPLLSTGSAGAIGWHISNLKS